MYQALYRKYRPRTFGDVSGQQHITDTLRRQVESGRLSHAYLFVGTRGTGKTSCAKILARAVNCEHPVNGEPCNACPSCLGIEDGSIMDVVEMDAASNNGVDNVRALRDEAIFSPVSTKKRVYIIDEVHMLTGSAFNALLKILEEPPEHLLFILATTELHKVPATILSRCQRFSFKRLTADDISARIKYVAGKEQMSITDGASDMLARLADGAMRDALSLLDQCSGMEVIDEERVLDIVGISGSGETVSLLHSIISGNAAEAVGLVDDLYGHGKDLASLLQELTRLIRDILILSVSGKNGLGLLSGSFDISDIKSFAKVPPARLFEISDLLTKANDDMSRSSNRRISAELSVIRMCDPAFGTGDSALNARVAKLEAQMAEGIPVIRDIPVIEMPEPEKKPEDIPPFDTPEAPEKPEAPPSVSVPEPEPEPVPEPEPESEPEPAANPSGDLWSMILSDVRAGTKDPAIYFLDSSEDISASLTGDVLSVKIKNATSLDILNKPEILDIIKKSAAKHVGKPVAVKMVSGDNTAPVQKKTSLDSLRRFSNIEFK